MLDTLRRIIQEVNRAPDLARALSIIVTRVKQAMVVDVCSVYLTDTERQQHVLMATDGYNPDAVGKVRFNFGEGLVGVVARREEMLNLDDASSHKAYVYTGEIGEDPFHGFLGVPIVQHRKVLGVLVVRQRERRRFAEPEETFLFTLAAQLAGAISHAGASGDITHLLQQTDESRYALKGNSGTPGAAVGHARVVYPMANLEAIPDRPAEDTETEIAEFRAAVGAVERDMRMMSARMVDSLPAEDIALFDALIMMLRSENLVEGTIERIRAGNWAPGALRETIVEHVDAFEAMEDPYLRERASDVRDLGRRILEHLQSTSPVQRSFEPDTILVGEEISASQLAEVPVQYLIGVVSARGSSASHVAILARALGIPAVMGVEDLPVNRLEGQNIVVDGYQARLFVRPSRAIREEFQRLQEEEAALSQDLLDLIELPSETPDGVHIPLYANTGLLSDISPSLRCGAEGVGLYRTEVPFMIRDRFPGEEEQFRIYRQVLEAFAPSPVTVRTLDIGGDKALPYFPVEEENPFLGWRGIRIALDHPEIFLTQVRAILRANAGLDNLQLMLPMISSVNEIDEAAGLVRRAHEELVEEGEQTTYPKIGVMIEVPSAVYQVPAMSKRVDFFSIGSNDLTQYLLAVDRNNAQVSDLYNALHPAVLRAIHQVVVEAHAHQRPVSVCGEMAGDPAAALLLLGMGVDSLSMSSASLLRVKWVLRSFNTEKMQSLLEETWLLEDATAVRALLHNSLDEAGLGGLIRAGR
ncbi:phosphotransferase system enzyme I (PtsP) [Thiogranum longum]|uniref:phosphoenolpyruvate--protein phosphotransferase n=1 Tax=Thiogranum longum TaxID=1537524 RepID=A0A4R1HBD3_9GAMM|nr:phosphoenolpyruvate--protein phosphotransferase [Thiogranum longum]TCK19267.1 phosphotransferase system enzyme I (PtsP) [Thiogranum longum]